VSSAAGSEDAIEFERRGLYDPAATDAFERLAILRELVALGATTDELAAARDELAWLAVRVVLRPGPRELTLAELAGAAGVTEERAATVWRAAGFPRPTPDARPFSEADVELLRSVEAGAVLFGDDTILQMVRVMGSAMARVADTVISAFLVNVSSRLAEHDAGDLVHARANLGIQELVPQLTAAVDVLLRHHLEALRRPGGAVIAPTGNYESQRVAVGFSDIVESSALAHGRSLGEIGALLRRFEAQASDTITSGGGRVIKLIGDEVMYVAPGAAAACRIALVLSDSLRAGQVPLSLRGGVAVGDVLTRDGDYFGPVVNLAARLVRLARAGDVLVSAAVRDEVSDDAELRFLPEGRRPGAAYREPGLTYQLVRAE
jgi:adenylate cyclase